MLYKNSTSCYFFYSSILIVPNSKIFPFFSTEKSVFATKKVIFLQQKREENSSLINLQNDYSATFLALDFLGFSSCSFGSSFAGSATFALLRSKLRRAIFLLAVFACITPLLFAESI